MSQLAVIGRDDRGGDFLPAELRALPLADPRNLEPIPSFTRREDGTVVVHGPFPEEMDFAVNLLDRNQMPGVWREGVRVCIRCVNGEADYVLTHLHPTRLVVRGARRYCRYSHAPAG